LYSFTLFIAASALPSGRFIMVFDLTLPGFSRKIVFGIDCFRPVALQVSPLHELTPANATLGARQRSCSCFLPAGSKPTFLKSSSPFSENSCSTSGYFLSLSSR
jgi:hypothetical protein